MGSTTDEIRIHYGRGGTEQLFVQRLIRREPGCVITLLDHTPLRAPMRIAGRTVLEPEAPAVWFTFPGAHHDIGRFHLLDGTFTGLYVNILTPVCGTAGAEWWTTDLYLDLWIDGDAIRVLDAEELANAELAGDVTAEDGAAARRETDRLLSAFRAGTWPPAVVSDWTLARARQGLERPTRAT